MAEQMSRHPVLEPGLLLDPAVSEAKDRAVSELIDQKTLGIAFQPIVDLVSHSTFGYEALARTSLPIFDDTVDLIESAVRAGRIGELGRLHREIAVKMCPDSPLFLNIHPYEFNYGWLVRPDDPIFRHQHPVFLEITESAPLKYFEQCHSVLAEVRKKGVLLAIDDLGAGYSNLKYISELAPDIVKLDLELVAGIESGTRQFRLIKSIVDLCKEMNAHVVAEGVETVQELGAVSLAGATFGQGYLLARPGSPPPKPVWPSARS